MQNEFQNQISQNEVSLKQAVENLIVRLKDLISLLDQQHKTSGLTVIQNEFYNASKKVFSITPDAKTYDSVNAFLAMFHTELVPLLGNHETYLKCKADFPSQQAKNFSKTVLDLTLYYSRILDFEAAERDKQKEKYLQ